MKQNCWRSLRKKDTSIWYTDGYTDGHTHTRTDTPTGKQAVSSIPAKTFVLRAYKNIKVKLNHPTYKEGLRSQTMKFVEMRMCRQ